MSVVVIDDQVVHYETFGRGRPVLFLHGWLGSWRYWMPTMDVIAEQMRAYSFDFWGFGDSQKAKASSDITIQNYSDQVIRFLDKMGIDRVMLVGHSMGGMVSVKTAINHPERISRLCAVGAPIDGESLSWLLKLTDNPSIARMMASMPGVTKQLFRYFLGRTDDPEDFEILNDSVKGTDISVNRSVHSMLRTDLRPELPRLRVPALIVHGGRDDVVKPGQVDLFRDVPAAEVVLFPESRHFPFLDESVLFNDVLLRFLKQSPSVPARPVEALKPVPAAVPFGR
jgi:pimeloyl-ACP methyl ester carboxylesterase